MAKITARDRPNAIARKRDEVIVPCDQLARIVKTGFEMMEAADAIKVVSEIVFAGPLQLHGCVDALRNHNRFKHEIVEKTAPKTTARASLMNDDIFFGQIQPFGDLR